MDEFKRFSIPVKWRKYIWVGIIGLLIAALKWLASENNKLHRDLKDCYQGRALDNLNSAESRRRTDSVWIERLMQQKLEKADREIIQPKLDSLKNGES